MLTFSEEGGGDDRKSLAFIEKLSGFFSEGGWKGQIITSALKKNNQA